MVAARLVVPAIVLACLPGIVPGASAQSDLGFQPPVAVEFPASTAPSRLRVADVTGDGLLDILVASYTQPGVFVRPGLPGLAFGPVAVTSLGAPVGSRTRNACCAISPSSATVPERHRNHLRRARPAPRCTRLFIGSTPQLPAERQGAQQRRERGWQARQS